MKKNTSLWIIQGVLALMFLFFVLGLVSIALAPVV